MRAPTVLTIALLVGGLVPALPLLAAGRGAAKEAAPAKGQDFTDAINQGMQKYVAKDIPASIELFRKATQLQPRNPLGHYLLGEAQLGAGSLPDAEAAWLQAEQVSNNGPASLKAKILFVLADLRERQGRWDDAKVAWKSYVDFSGSADAGSFPESGRTRTRDIEAMQKQYADYAVVRKRIREEDGGTIGKMPPPEQP
jgi:tetratricopeptide (TPR) repeat protein